MAESSTKRQRVGQRQRLRAVSTDEALQTSKLATYLEEQWSWGYMSAQTCQKIAALAVFDMEAAGVEQAPLSLRKISAIGTCGSHSQNCHRDFLALVATKTKICKPLQEKVPFKDGLYLQSIMLPHELFHCMWKEYKEYFIHALAPGGSNRLVSFWKSFEKHPCMQSGAMTAIRQHRSYPHRCLPVGMHGDAVPTTGVGKIWTKMQLCFSWFCLLRRKGSKASNFLIWSVPWLWLESSILMFLLGLLLHKSLFNLVQSLKMFVISLDTVISIRDSKLWCPSPPWTTCSRYWSGHLGAWLLANFHRRIGMAMSTLPLPVVWESFCFLILVSFDVPWPFYLKFVSLGVGVGVTFCTQVWWFNTSWEVSRRCTSWWVHCPTHLLDGRSRISF